ncbi:MAG TPA: glycosyltransferase family A protein [Thermoanaerobaculia bacterium]|nr:glycosyltransferase family A protein [Thermoanaerobaculia bacterium]
MSARVTVAVPVYNGARFLARTLESLLAQEHDAFDVVVIDDQSTDDSAAIAQSAGVRVVRNEVRLGLAGNWNAAFALAETPLLVIAHQDDVYEPRFLATTERLLDTHPRAFIAHTRALYIDEHERPAENAASRYKDRFWPADEPYEREPDAELRVLQGGNYIICPAVMYRMSAVAKIGAFNERYRFVPDWEYWLRGLLAGFTIAGTHERLLRWRRHDESATRQEEATLRRYDEELELLERLSRMAGLPRSVSLVENTLLSEFAARLARGDRAGAAALRDYARGRLRRAHAIMRLGMIGGRAAGHALKLAESLYTRL